MRPARQSPHYTAARPRFAPRRRARPCSWCAGSRNSYSLIKLSQDGAALVCGGEPARDLNGALDGFADRKSPSSSYSLIYALKRSSVALPWFD